MRFRRKKKHTSAYVGCSRNYFRISLDFILVRNFILQDIHLKLDTKGIFSSTNGTVIAVLTLNIASPKILKLQNCELKTQLCSNYFHTEPCVHNQVLQLLSFYDSLL